MFTILQIFFCNTRGFENWAHHQDIPQFQLGDTQSRDAFRQSRASENIS